MDVCEPLRWMMARSMLYVPMGRNAFAAMWSYSSARVRLRGMVASVLIEAEAEARRGASLKV